MFDWSNFRLREHLNVWYFLIPANTKDGLKTTNMESLKSLNSTSVRGPCFAAVQQHRDTDSLVDSHLGGDGKITIEEDSMQESVVGRRGLRRRPS